MINYLLNAFIHFSERFHEKIYFCHAFRPKAPLCVVICANSGAKVYKLLNYIEIIAVSRDLRSHTSHVLTCRQHIFRLALIYRQAHFRKLPFDSTKRIDDIWHRASNDVNVVSVRKKLDILVENSAVAHSP